MTSASAQANAPSPRPARLSRGMLAFAFFGGAGAWTLHLLGAYVLAEFGCVAGWGRRTWLGVNAVAWAVLVLSVLLLALAGAATLAARRGERATAAAEGDGVRAHLARTAWIADAIFALVIVVQSVPVFYYLEEC